MKNNLIRTDTVWYKIKKFLIKKINKNQYYYENKTQEELKKEKFRVSLKEQNLKNNKNQGLTNKLLKGEIGSSEITNIEVEEMINFFLEDIKKLDIELLKIKKHINEMKQELKS